MQMSTKQLCLLMNGSVGHHLPDLSKSLNTLLRTIKEHFENTSDFTGGK